MRAKSSEPIRDAVAQLRAYFDRNGYIRWQSPKRVKKEDWDSYKKGDEVRLVAESQRELSQIRRLLRKARFRPGRSFVKGGQFRQPLYGREAVERFLILIGVAPAWGTLSATSLMKELSRPTHDQPKRSRIAVSAKRRPHNSAASQKRSR